MSRSITFVNTMKKYEDFTVIPDLSLKIEKGEFFTLLGPSGCGKTTLLRMVAGFISIERGEIYFDDTLINHVPPRHRNIGMVFQDYALFPHLTIERNIAFGLRNRRVGKVETEAKVNEMLDIIQMNDHRGKLPEQLSGGQQQRIALARAMAFYPDVLLMDEPLSNLDAALRVEMRNVISKLQKQVGITTIYVTHDQEEAMAISDRIAVMDKGIIQQVGTPREIYQRPTTLFVAGFVGETNVLQGRLLGKNGKNVLDLGENYEKDVPTAVELKDGEERQVQVSVRPEEFAVNFDGLGLAAQVKNRTFLGLTTHYEVQLKNGGDIKLIRESVTDDALSPGTKISLAVKAERINIYDKQTQLNLSFSAPQKEKTERKAE